MATNNATNTSNPITVGQGGTGVATLTTAYGVLCAGTTATGAVQTLASLGSSTQVLTSNGAGALPSFQAAAGASGGLTFIATATANTSATIDFANQLTSTYDNYMVVIEDLLPDTNAVTFELLFGTGAGPTYQTSNYLGGTVSCNPVSSGTWSNQSSGSYIFLFNSAYSYANYTSSAVLYITNVNNSSNYKTMFGMGTYGPAGTSPYSTRLVNANALWQGATVLTSLRFLYSTGNILSGVFKLYGFKN